MTNVMYLKPTHSPTQKDDIRYVFEYMVRLLLADIDPEGMSATDILRIFYARGSGSFPICLQKV